MAGIFIDDGFTLDGKTQAAGRFPSIRFQYRPALPVAVYAYMRAPKGTGEEELRAVITLLSAHVVSWDAKDGKGETVPVTPEALSRVAHPVLQKLIDVVTGYGEQLEADRGN